GSMQVTPLGLAASLSVSGAVTVGDFSFAASAITVQVNTGSAAAVIADPVTAGATIRIPAGPFIRIQALGVTVSVGGIDLHGNFLIEQTTNQLGQKRTTIATTGLTVKIGSTDLLTNASGAIILVPGTAPTGGLVGQISGT